MADLPQRPDPDASTGAEPDRGPGPGVPRWVKVLGIVALVLAALVALVLITGIGGRHGPGRHTPSDGSHTSIPGVTESSALMVTNRRWEATDPR